MRPPCATKTAAPLSCPPASAACQTHASGSREWISRSAWLGGTEFLSLSGTVAINVSDSGSHSGSHLHMALSTSTGEVFGGHVAQGCIVRTTAEVLLALPPEWEFARVHYALTGYDELVVRAADVAD